MKHLLFFNIIAALIVPGILSYKIVDSKDQNTGTWIEYFIEGEKVVITKGDSQKFGLVWSKKKQMGSQIIIESKYGSRPAFLMHLKSLSKNTLNFKVWYVYYSEKGVVKLTTDDYSQLSFKITRFTNKTFDAVFTFDNLVEDDQFMRKHYKKVYGQIKNCPIIEE